MYTEHDGGKEKKRKEIVLLLRRSSKGADAGAHPTHLSSLVLGYM